MWVTSCRHSKRKLSWHNLKSDGDTKTRTGFQSIQRVFEPGTSRRLSLWRTHSAQSGCSPVAAVAVEKRTKLPHVEQNLTGESCNKSHSELFYFLTRYDNILRKCGCPFSCAPTDVLQVTDWLLAGSACLDRPARIGEKRGRVAAREEVRAC
jgi:hypothetical protein